MYKDVPQETAGVKPSSLTPKEIPRIRKNKHVMQVFLMSMVTFQLLCCVVVLIFVISSRSRLPQKFLKANIKKIVRLKALQKSP